MADPVGSPHLLYSSEMCLEEKSKDRKPLLWTLVELVLGNSSDDSCERLGFRVCPDGPLAEST